MLNIGGLNQGVVIDHIKAGHAMQIYHYLNLEKLDCSVAIIKNAKSNKMGKKDIIKIEGPLCVDLDILGVLDDNITINIIENEKIVQKRTLTLPEMVTNIIKCKNHRCITSIDKELLLEKENEAYIEKTVTDLKEENISKQFILNQLQSSFNEIEHLVKIAETVKRSNILKSIDELNLILQ